MFISKFIILILKIVWADNIKPNTLIDCQDVYWTHIPNNLPNGNLGKSINHFLIERQGVDFDEICDPDNKHETKWHNNDDFYPAGNVQFDDYVITASTYEPLSSTGGLPLYHYDWFPYSHENKTWYDVPQSKISTDCPNFDAHAVFDSIKAMGEWHVSGYSWNTEHYYDYILDFRPGKKWLQFEYGNKSKPIHTIGNDLVTDFFLNTDLSMMVSLGGDHIFLEAGYNRVNGVDLGNWRKRLAIVFFELDTSAERIYLDSTVERPAGEYRFYFKLNSCEAENLVNPDGTEKTTGSTKSTASTSSPNPTDSGPNPTDSGPNPTDSGPNPTDSGPNPTDSGPNPTDEEDLDTIDEEDSSTGALIGGIASAAVIAGAAAGAGFYYTGGSSGGDYDFEDMEFASHSDEVVDKEQFIDMGRTVRNAMQNQ